MLFIDNPIMSLPADVLRNVRIDHSSHFSLGNVVAVNAHQLWLAPAQKVAASGKIDSAGRVAKMVPGGISPGRIGLKAHDKLVTDLQNAPGAGIIQPSIPRREQPGRLPVNQIVADAQPHAHIRPAVGVQLDVRIV